MVAVLLGQWNGTLQTEVNCPVGSAPYRVTVADLNNDSIPDLSAPDYGGTQVSVLRGNGDGTFQPYRSHGGPFLSPTAVAAGDLSGDGVQDLAVTDSGNDIVSVMLGRDSTITAGLICSPSSGTLPFITQMSTSLTNIYVDQVRRMAARINISLAGGGNYVNWRAGWTNLDPGESFGTSWYQNLPALSALVGDNTFTLVAVDVTPAPYNQPPYPPAGDTDTAVCVIQGMAP